MIEKNFAVDHHIEGQTYFYKYDNLTFYYKHYELVASLEYFQSIS